MKSLVVILVIALSAGIAQAKPPKGKTTKAAAAPTCELDELSYWGTPDPNFRRSQQSIIVLLKCTNHGKTPARLDSRDVTLINSDGDQFGPDRSSGILDAVYNDMIYPPKFVARFIEIAPGDTLTLAFSFSGDDGLTDNHLTVDVNGVKFTHERAATESDSFDW